MTSWENGAEEISRIIRETDWSRPPVSGEPRTEGCGYPTRCGVTEWRCNGIVSHIVIGLSGSGWYETRMPRCLQHVQPTIAGLNPPGSPYPHHSLGRVEEQRGDSLAAQEESA